MSFGLIRVRKLSTSMQIATCETHNARLYEQKNIPTPNNIKAQNKAIFGTNEHKVILGGEEVQESVLNVLKMQFEKMGIKPRKNSVHALEYVVALSPDCKTAYENNTYSADGMLDNLTRFIGERHGWENVVSISKHFDETNPHAHVVVMPIVKKGKRWKNKNGEGIKTEYALSARDYVGGRDKLRALQTEYYQYVKVYEKELGVEFHRGVDARDQKKHYTSKTFFELGELEEAKRKLLNKEKNKHYETIKAKETGKDSFNRFNPFAPKKGTNNNIMP